MKKNKRHIIAVLLIIVLASLLEILVFNRDVINSPYTFLRFNVADDEDQTHAATGYTMLTEVVDYLSPLTEEETNEIKVRQDNERILAEYNQKNVSTKEPEHKSSASSAENTAGTEKAGQAGEQEEKSREKIQLPQPYNEQHNFRN